MTRAIQSFFFCLGVKNKIASRLNAVLKWLWYYSVIKSQVSCWFFFNGKFIEQLVISFVLQNQIYKEITYTLKSVPSMGFLTALVFLLEVNGYSKLYDNFEDSKFGKWIVGFCATALVYGTPVGWNMGLGQPSVCLSVLYRTDNVWNWSDGCQSI